MFLKLNFRSKRKNDVKSFSDEDLIHLYKKSQNEEYLSELFERYTHLVFGVCMKYLRDEEESKDAVLVIFENLMTSLHKQNVANFKSWIYSVSKNHCLMYLRKTKAMESNQSEYLEIMKKEVMESEDFFHLNDSLEIEEKIPLLMKAIEKLNEEQRNCIELLYLQDKSYLEVSMITGYSLKQVKSYIQNGKRNLKNFLETK
jgi:RNA polymerase sigma factor (sigma-70 family)